MTALKLAEAEKGPGLAEMVQQAYSVGITENEIKRAVGLMIDVKRKDADTIIIREDVKDSKRLWIKPCKYMG